ncbi:hypothetical protein BS78_03G141900 [Paspalum vaginatum]|nr:hypothetical protein BS78_03G141900 [Paspalum vaginatum]
MPKDDLPSTDTFPDEVESYVDVLAPIVEDRVLGELNGGPVVHPQDRHAGLLSCHLPQQPPETHRLAAHRRSRDVLRLARREGDNPLLHALPGDHTPAEEEEHARGAPSAVDVAAHVAVAVPDEVRLSAAPGVHQPIFDRPSHVADDVVHGGPVILPRLRHESADIADRERQVRAHVYQVPQPADDAAIARRVHLPRLAQLELLLHRDLVHLALTHATPLQQLTSVGALAQRDAVLPLLHLYAQIVGEQPEVAHVEGALHLLLERLDLLLAGAGDHQIIDVDADHQPPVLYPLRVQRVLGLAPLELHLLEHGVELQVPRPQGLPKAIQSLAQAEHPVLLAADDVAQWPLDVDLLLELPVQEHGLHVHVVDIPGPHRRQREQEPH